MTRLTSNFPVFLGVVILFACGEGVARSNANTPPTGKDFIPASGHKPDQNRCSALQPVSDTDNIIIVNPAQAQQLQGIIAAANQGDIILLEDGYYDLNGSYIWFSTPGITLRSVSGNPDAVILDGSYLSTEIITLAASDLTIAEISITGAYTHAIHVTTGDSGNTSNSLIYRVNIIDTREQAIKINPHKDNFHVDDGVIACSSIVLTSTGRKNINPDFGGCYTGGIDAHQAKGWSIRDNTIEGFWCSSGLSEYAIHFWRGSRDTIIERNFLKDNARGIGLGLSDKGTARTYAENLCPGAKGIYIGHYGGVIRNNFIHASSADLMNSANGFDCGICLWSACKAMAIHNSIISTGNNYSSIEWRFAGATGIKVHNNIVSHPLRERDGASANLSGNLKNAKPSLFVDGLNGDLHLSFDATAAINRGVTLNPGLADFDIDGEARDRLPDIGADER